MMHELAVAHALLKQMAGLMGREQATNVTRVTLRIGSLSGIEPALLHAAYAEARKDSVLANAELVIINVPVCIYCAGCKTESEVFPNCLTCPRCGRGSTQLLRGDDMLIESIDLVM